MPFDREKFASYLTANAAKHSQSHCARFVRRALEAGGADTKGHPEDAKRYGPVLIHNGFHALTVDNPLAFRFLKGDVVVIQPSRNGNQSGHIAGYDGKQWVSDFVQHGFWPGPAYEKERPSYVVYRR